MISSLVSSILSGVTSPATAERAAARQAPDHGPGQAGEDASRPAATTSVAAAPAAGRAPGPAVDHGGPADRVDYFHAAKHMLGKAMAGFRRDLRDAVTGLGFDDGIGGKLTQAVMREARSALLGGAGFSVKLMTATVSQTVASGAAPSFSVTARSIEITVNHATGAVGVEAGDVSIRSHSSGAPGEAAPHLLDIEDSGDAAAARLMAALQALRNPEALLEDDDRGAGEAGDAAPAMQAETAALPPIDTPAVLTRPGYSARIMVTAMEQVRDERGDRLTRLRLDAVIPLSERPREPGSTASVQSA